MSSPNAGWMAGKARTKMRSFRREQSGGFAHRMKHYPAVDIVRSVNGMIVYMCTNKVRRRSRSSLSGLDAIPGTDNIGETVAW